jgi:hypothetical protein
MSIYLDLRCIFFLEYAGGLRIIALRKKKSRLREPKQTTTPQHTHTTPQVFYIFKTHLFLKRKRRPKPRLQELLLSTMASSNQTSKSLGACQHPVIRLLLCKEKSTIQPGRDTIKQYVVPFLPKNPCP